MYNHLPSQSAPTNGRSGSPADGRSDVKVPSVTYYEALKHSADRAVTSRSKHHYDVCIAL